MQCTTSTYLQSRRHNRKLFAKIRDAISQLNFQATATLDMSAKSQMPLVIVRGAQHSEAADEIYHILQEYFQVFEPEWTEEDTTDILFDDAY